ncbi:hypothetical protein [Acetobacterium wieringae]|uniref:Transmembrane protein n=1 Tax=Acetobacterium wieringae TaxID=52694 RepID=A0A1F2PJV8_9FIRM|nr:hypothetical protein [Acetobacterium wieringae]OFV71305.1 hypothetical protein ACWI_12190 [Acetobacterium wieringae]
MKKEPDVNTLHLEEPLKQNTPKIRVGLLKYFTKPSTLGVLVLCGLLFVVLFLPPVIGMGDDGSTAAIITGSDLYNLGELTPKEAMAYFQKNWGIMEYYNDSDNGQITSQTPFLNAARNLDRAYTWDGLFDMRFYGAVIAIFYLIAMYFLFETVTYGKRARWSYVIVGLGVIIFGDTAYTAWINSFYPQALSFFLVMILGTSLILMGQKKLNDYLLIGCFFLSGLLLCLLNQQYALLGLFLGILGISLKYVSADKYYIRICVVGGSLLMLCSLTAFFVMPNGLTNLSAYHSMTRGVLMTAENPEQALKEFSINPQYAVLTGTSYYQAIAPETMDSQEMESAFFSKVNPTGVAIYYLANPGQLYEMLNRSVDSSFNIRPAWLGNYEITQGYAPGAQTSFFTLWSFLKANYLPGNFGFIIIWMGVIIGVYVRFFRKGIIEKNERNTLRFVGLMTWLFIGLWELYVAIITSGDADTLGHLFIFSLTFDLISFIILGKFIHWIEKQLRKVDWEARKQAFLNRNKNKQKQREQRGYRL